MIKANELRIGNWVQGSIDKAYYRWEALDFEMASEGDSDPIPLTPEILERAGFIWNGSVKHWTITWGRNGVHFVKFDEHYERFSFQLGEARYKVIDHLHQLQNLYFALTGEELSIELTPSIHATT